MATRQSIEKPKILLDWFTVRYRTLVTFGVILLIAGSVGAYYAYQRIFFHGSPKSEAREAIDGAEEALNRAAPIMEDEAATDLKRNAQRLLAEARRQFDAANYLDARRAAVESKLNAEKAISLSRGEASREVQFYKVEGDVKVKRARELIWAHADEGMTLSAGDQVKTSSRASAQIIYSNGTITTIRPGSLLEIKTLFDDPSTRVHQVRERLREGQIASSTQGGAEGSFHEISTQNSTAVSNERANLEVVFDKASTTTRVEVHSGRATLSTGDGKRTVQISEHESVSVDAAANLSQVERMLPAPQLMEPPDQKIFLVRDSQAPSVQLEWKPVAGASRYRLQISSQPLFSGPEVDLGNITSTTATLPSVREGGYYWRVASIVQGGKQSPFGAARRFKVMPSHVARAGDTQPPPLTVDDFLVFASQIIIRGRTEPGALLTISGNRVDVYDDGSFTTVVPLRHVGVNQVTFVAQDMAGNENRIERVARVDNY